MKLSTLVHVLLDLWRCVFLVWRNRHLRVGSVSGYALACLSNSEMVKEVRHRYPSRRFFWSFSTNHVLDSDQQYLAVWEVLDRELGVRCSLLYHGPRSVLMHKLLEEGVFDLGVVK